MDRGTIERSLREAIVLRTCVATGNDYEFNLHVQTISERMGLTPAQIDDIRSDQPSVQLWRGEYLAVMTRVDGLAKRIQVSEEAYADVPHYFADSHLDRDYPAGWALCGSRDAGGASTSTVRSLPHRSADARA
jgi:hypothetical protein